MSRVRVIEIMRPGPRGAPGDMDPAEWDAWQARFDRLEDRVVGFPKAPNLFAHWDAQQIVAVDGSRVSAWSDRTAGIAATQATAGKQPEYRASGINGNPALYFDNARGDALVTGTLAPSSLTPTIFLVTNGTHPASGGSARYAFGTDRSGASVRNVYFNAFPGVSLQGSPILSSTVDAGRPRVLAARFNGAASSIRVDGIVVASGNTGTATLAPTILTLGHRNSQAAGNGFTGFIGEVLYYDRALTDDECATVERYLAEKWDLDISEQTIWFVDSVFGSDSNTGRTATTAKATINAAISDINNVGADDATILVSAPQDTPVRTSTPINCQTGGTIRVASRTPGIPWYCYGSVKHTSGWTDQGGGVYSKAMAISSASNPIAFVPTLMDAFGQPVRLLTRNTATPTTPAAGEYGYSSGIYYLHLPADANPNEHTVEVVHASSMFFVASDTTLVLRDGELFGAQVGVVSAGTSAGPVDGAATVYAYDTNARFAGDSPWRTSQYIKYFYAERCGGYYGGNDGFNHHCVNGVNSPLMELVDCEGAWNADEGVSPHDTTRLILQRGRFHHNAFGGLTSVNDAVTQLYGTEFDHNRLLDSSVTPPGSDIGGVSILGNSVLESYELYSHDHPGPGIEVSATATWIDNGGTRSGTEHGNGAADVIGE